MLASPEIRVLGDLDVRIGGRPVAVGGAVPRALLLRLTLAGGATVVDGVLQDDLWDGAPPPSAPGTVQAHVSRLRRALQLAGADRDAQPLVRRGSGYALVLDDGALDARTFERLAARGRAQLDDDPEAAAALLDEGLALWRGPALVDVAHRPWAEAEAQRLEQLRVAAREDRVAADLALGRETAAAAGAESLVAADPLRERGWELLAVALYRQGRQADALARLRELRDLLAEELGTDPGPVAAALVRRVLSHDPTLLLAPAAAPPVPRPAPVAAPAPPAAAASPAVSSLAVTSNLPASPTPLVGRVQELEQVAALLDEHRLITLTGTGGTGKTRLALEVARRRTDADGPWLVRLAAVEDGDRVAGAVAAALGVVLPPGGPAAEVAAVAAALRGRELLLVLDDCEHLVDDVAEVVDELLGSCPRARVLVTSREALRVDGEHIYEVPVLSGGPDGDAVRLFAARAAAAAPGWRVGPGDAEGVARLCAALDGLPLAVELSAAQLRTMSLDDLLGLLDDHEALLRGGRRTTSRHATMQGTIAWSYDRLDTAEQEVLTGLTVFAGSFDLAAAQAVLGRSDLLAVVSDLVARSLLAVSPPGGPRRFWLLSVVRRFAAERLDERRRSELVARHVAWVVSLAESAPRELRGLAGTEAMTRIVAVRDDVDAALAVAGPADAVRISVGAFWSLYNRAVLTGDRARRLHAALEAVEAAPAGDPDGAVDERTLSRAWVCLNLLRRMVGDAAGGTAALERAAVHAERAEDPLSRARVLTNRSLWAALADGDAAAARRDALAALAIAEEAGSGPVRADALLALGASDLVEPALDRAVEHLEECVAAADAAHHPSVALTARQLQAKAELVLGRTAPAWRAAMDSAERAWQLGETAAWLVVLGHLAAVLVRAGDAAGAVLVMTAVEAQGARVGFAPGLVDPDVAGFQREVAAAPLPAPGRAAAVAAGAARAPEDVMDLLRSLSPGAPSAEGPGGDLDLRSLGLEDVDLPAPRREAPPAVR